VRSIDPGRDLFGQPGHRYVTIFYDPADPNHVEGVDGLACQGIVIIVAGIATLGFLITRAGKKQGPGPTPRSEIHRSIVR
jgi:hypothetical protein